MKKVIICPERILPHHLMTPNPDIVDKYNRNIEVPPIPIIEIPEDLFCSTGHRVKDLGDFIAYNGHKRRISAISLGLPRVKAVVIENQEDFDYLIDNNELLKWVESRDVEAHKRALHSLAYSHLPIVLQRENRMLGRECPFAKYHLAR